MRPGLVAITKGEIVEDLAPERGSGSWVQVADWRASRALFQEGLFQQASMTHGNWGSAPQQFEFAGIQTVVH